PRTEICPSVGKHAPAMRRNSVLLPEPFCPTRPTVSPRRTSRLMARSGQNSSGLGARPTRRSTGLRRRNGWRSKRRKALPTASSLTISGSAARAPGWGTMVAIGSDIVEHQALVVAEREPPDGEHQERRDHDARPAEQGRPPAEHHRAAQAGQNAAQRIAAP